MPPKPKFLNPREEEFWRHRFDPDSTLSIAQIESKLGIDRSYFRTAVAKLVWNAQHGFQTSQFKALINLALETTPVGSKDNPYLIEELVAKRAQHVNWERRYRKK